MIEPETFRFADDGRFPNSRLPLLIYRRALPADADRMEQRFGENGWTNAWRNGVFPFHHFHSNAHEVLGVAAGEVRVAFGGPAGEVVSIRAGDVVVIPAGVAHCNRGQSPGPLIVGAYPGGAEYDTKLGEPTDYVAAKRAIAAVQLPATDPVSGKAGPLRRLWGPAE
ncbi:MAG: cupin domain-containing protein [Acetobacteraceae bacterium]|nr:cupin domain-containing protein [Acetobacteraceae bacterium]